MKTIQELKDERGTLLRQVEETHEKAKAENRSLTNEERTLLDNSLATSDELLNKITALEDAEREARIASALDDLNKPQVRKASAVDPNQTPDDRVYATAKRDWKLKAFGGYDAARRAYECGRWLHGMVFGNDASYKWCRDRGMIIEPRAMSTFINTAGGYLVPDQFAQAIIDLRETYGVFRRFANVVPMTSDTLVIPRRTSGVTAYYIGENSALTESEAVFGQVNLTAKKLAVLTRISSELSDDAFINIADWLVNDAAWQMAYQEDLAGFTGTGAGTYGGIWGLTSKLAAAAYAGSKVAAPTAAHDTFPELDYDDLTTLVALLPAYAHPRAKFYCSAAAKAVVFDNLSISAGGARPIDVSGALQPSFLGYPIITSPVLPASLTTDYTSAVMILFGDLSLSSTMGTRSDIRVQLDASRYMEYDQVAVKVTERFDIANHDLGDTTNAGPMVALHGGSG